MDFIIDGEAKVTRIIQGGQGVIWKSVQELLPDFQYDVISYGPSILKKNPEAGKRFMVAYLKAVRQINRGKTDQNLEILAKYTGLDRELIRKACWSQFRSDGRINVKSIFDFQSCAVKKGLLDTPTTEKQFWDSRFIEHANNILGSVAK